MDGRRFVFLDETAATTAMTRLYGWGTRGERLVDAARRHGDTGRPQPSSRACAVMV
jgi:hypothetical protein